MYYNTNNETGSTLAASRSNSMTQETIILEIFKNNTNEEFTPTEILSVIGFQDPNCNWPITSIRRALSDLTSENKLTKTDNQKLGPYGKHEFTWKLA